MKRGFEIILVTVIFLAVSGCVLVKPWERDTLSKRVMTFDAEVDESTLDHTYYNAREGATGGFESGGGGCGCN